MTESTEKTYKELLTENAKIVLLLAELVESHEVAGLMILLCKNMKQITLKIEKDGLL